MYLAKRKNRSYYIELFEKEKNINVGQACAARKLGAQTRAKQDPAIAPHVIKEVINTWLSDLRI